MLVVRKEKMVLRKDTEVVYGRRNMSFLYGSKKWCYGRIWKWFTEETTLSTDMLGDVKYVLGRDERSPLPK